MSFARFGSEDSDVYVFEQTGGAGFECCACDLAPAGSLCVVVPTVGLMLEHLREHLTAGHVVPESAFVKLVERERDGPAVYLRTLEVEGP